MNKHHGWLVVISLVIFGFALVSPAAGEPEIQPYAQTILKQMSSYLSAAGYFTVRSEVITETVLASGQKIQLNRYGNIAVKRPNKIWGDFSDDFIHNRMFYDGKSFTMMYYRENLYATTAAPGTIDEALDHILDNLGIDITGADFAHSNPYEILTEKVVSGYYAGRHLFEGQKMHHLVFSQDNIDWQIWIQDGRKIVPQKLVITYKNKPGMPQSTFHLSGWDFGTNLPDSLFTFEPPVGAKKINFLPLP
jgi:hypothetical protein